jgi:hypothetical protein
MKYRELTNLSYAEICELLNYVFNNSINTVRVVNRDEKRQVVTCEFNFNGMKYDSGEPLFDIIYINMYVDFDTNTLESDNFDIDGEEMLRAGKYLIAKGCHPLFKDNPYIEKKTNKERLSELVLQAKGVKRSIRAFAKEIGCNSSTLTRIINMQNRGCSSYQLMENIAKYADPKSNVTLEVLMEANCWEK